MFKTLPLRTLGIFIAALFVLQAGVLFFFGQPSICECGYVKVWEGVVQSAGNSQHLTDWYTPSHLLHGIFFFALFSLLMPRASIGVRLLAALALEISWEIIENTPMVIEHYRKQVLAQGYVGDSILNSLSDTVAMVAGFFFTARVPVWVAILTVIGFEALTMYFIKDGLFLNIINLLYPFEFIKQWQLGG
jgi:hypothetical protein